MSNASFGERFPLEMLIGGEWVGAVRGGTWDLVDPGTEEVVQQVPFGGAEDASRAIDAAAAAYPEWAAKTAYARGKVLERAADWIKANVDDLARITTEESGKPLADSKGEWLSATGYLNWFAGEGVRVYGRTVPAQVPGRRISVVPQPLGVVATITAWNFPIYNIVRTWGAALAAGNTVVGRPSEYTPRSAMLLGQALAEAGAPAGVINVVNGDPGAMGQAFLNDARVRKLAFTGSPRVGRLLMDGASRTLTRLALELGGNAPVIVFPDAKDLPRLAKLAARFKVRNAGQVCIAPQRYLIHESVVDDFTARVVEAMRELKVGHGLEEGVQVGPLINARQLVRVTELVSSAAAGGASVVTGGAALDRRGYFYEPTVVTGVEPGSPLFEEEIFGPVLPISTFGSAQEVLDKANSTEFGLAAYVFTSDLNTAIAMSERLEFGMVAVNDWMPVTPEAPFGGVKGSGIGRETGAEGILEYLDQKAVFIGGVELP
ncbi:MAG: NAD-dependent succinate-semialdehyde dehydrogenase [Truepera sp.]|nr:NAD-dependent succinate-semialdehyde dehydrogenase [Truepera sp.]HRN18895.1 NAD-dependent succinate-semialdehyde dehydrogenase [Trueperaceae bacterium]HRQ11251.1 NAD-dependent succinate-semialdehyde dehydrogenase [Trueperaceae bacterium]